MRLRPTLVRAGGQPARTRHFSTINHLSIDGSPIGVHGDSGWISPSRTELIGRLVAGPCRARDSNTITPPGFAPTDSSASPGYRWH